MMKGRIAIPAVDPKTWRSRGRKRKQQPAIASAIVAPGPMKKRAGAVIPQASDNGQDPPPRSAIVEPKRVPDDYDPGAHRRAGEKADELFREIKRRIAAAKRD